MICPLPAVINCEISHLLFFPSLSEMVYTEGNRSSAKQRAAGCQAWVERRRNRWDWNAGREPKAGRKISRHLRNGIGPVTSRKLYFQKSRSEKTYATEVTV
jgi:hypothetical protein